MFSRYRATEACAILIPFGNQPPRRKTIGIRGSKARLDHVPPQLSPQRHGPDTVMPFLYPLLFLLLCLLYAHPASSAAAICPALLTGDRCRPGVPSKVDCPSYALAYRPWLTCAQSRGCTPEALLEVCLDNLRVAAVTFPLLGACTDVCASLLVSSPPQDADVLGTADAGGSENSKAYTTSPALAPGLRGGIARFRTIPYKDALGQTHVASSESSTRQEASKSKTFQWPKLNTPKALGLAEPPEHTETDEDGETTTTTSTTTAAPVITTAPRIAPIAPIAPVAPVPLVPPNATISFPDVLPIIPVTTSRPIRHDCWVWGLCP